MAVDLTGAPPESQPVSSSNPTTQASTSANPLQKSARLPASHSFVGTAWLGPQVGVATMVVLSAFNFDAAPATIWGAIAWVVSWLASGLAYGPSTSPDRANARNYGELINRLATLEARRDQLCGSLSTQGAASTPKLASACAEATAHLDWVREQATGPGDMRWVNGAGYIAIWQRLHRAEEALLGVEPGDELLDEVIHDELRLKGSAIPNRDDLIGILKTVKKYLCDGKVDPTSDPCIKNDEEAASALTEVRFSINDFRDTSWNGLLQLRNQTMATVLLTNITLFAFVVVVVVGGARGHAILAATVFYLVGVGVGLLNRLYQHFQALTAVEDYGLTMARLVAIPVYSGAAAVAGVLITVLAGTATGAKAPDLGNLFIIPPAIGLLVVAAAFGATPDLVLKRLADASEKFKSGIQSTQPGNRQ